MMIKQQGAAIIVALFVMSLVAIAAIAMIEHLQMDMRRTTLLFNDLRAECYANGALAWAMDQLNQDIEKQQKDKVIDRTPIRLPSSHMDEALIESVIFDAQGRFNINNLIDVNYRDDFVRLIQAVIPTMDVAAAKVLTQNVVEWVTAVHQHDDYYATLNPAYRVPHRAMQSVSELRLVKGFDQALYQAVSPYLIALPETTQVNINNAEPPVLMSIGKTLTMSSAKSIALQRMQAPWVSIAQFSKFDVVKNNPIPTEKITVQSRYFLVKTNVKVGQQESLIYTLISRAETKTKPSVNILWQSKGTL